MSLALYKKKRNLNKTPEPDAATHTGKGKLIFVVQRHQASRLHYDFRLELNGLLKSWAVPKGPSMNPKDKRLAMMVEDHPYNYHSFKGTIPEGNYGAGVVEIWDSGTYTSINNLPYKDDVKNLNGQLENGSLKFVLHGKKLKGEFALVKMKNRGENAWLLLKHRDDESADEPYSSDDFLSNSIPVKKVKAAKVASVKKAAPKKAVQIIEPEPASVSGRKKEKVAGAVKPMLAREIDKPFSDPNWLYEIKWDGYRAVADLEGQYVQLYSRNAVSFNDLYPTIIQALQQLNFTAILDGEVVALDEEGHADFNKLQLYAENKTPLLVYYVFDILSVNGDGITGLPLIERKQVLKEMLPENEIIKYSDHVLEDGIGFFEVIREKNMEGIMAKKGDSKYLPGVRTDDWLKIKHQKSEDVYIAGFTAPQGKRQYFGALILASKMGKEYHYAGHVGTGFSLESLKFLYNKMSRLIQPASPVKEHVTSNRPVTWVKPDLKCEVRFTEWTKEGIMRHPAFLGLKPDNEVIPMPSTKIADAEDGGSAKTKTGEQSERSKSGDLLKFGKIKVPITNRNKLYWPDEKITKGMVVDYYQEIADYMLPYLKTRPQSLRRNPNGIADAGFFQKDAGNDVPDWVETVSLPAESANRDVDYIICNNKATLAYLNNLGCIEINPWNSTLKKIDYPDYLIIDIDPSEKNTYDQVIDVALAAKAIFDKAGCTSFCKTSGATGMHVFVPMGRKYEYEAVKNFAEIVATMLTEQLPKLASIERSLNERGDMIYMDFLQNRKGQTISAVYSLRPKSGATVSTPLLWKEVKHGLDPYKFNIRTIPKRLDKQGDLFAGVLGKGVDLRKALKELGE